MAPSKLHRQLELDTCFIQHTKLTPTVLFLNALVVARLLTDYMKKHELTSCHLSGICPAPPKAINRAGYSEPPAKTSDGYSKGKK